MHSFYKYIHCTKGYLKFHVANHHRYEKAYELILFQNIIEQNLQQFHHSTIKTLVLRRVKIKELEIKGN